MYRREGRDLDRRRLGVQALVFFAVGVVDLAVAIEMTSGWMATAAASCGIAGSATLSASRCKRRTSGRG